MHSASQMVLAQSIDERPLNTTKSYEAKQKEWVHWCRDKGLTDGELASNVKLNYFLSDFVMNRGRKLRRNNDGTPMETPRNLQGNEDKAVRETISEDEAAPWLEKQRASNGIPLDKFRASWLISSSCWHHFIRIGVEAPVIRGIMVQGDRCDTIAMGLAYNGIYRMMRLGNSTLCLSLQQFGIFPVIFSNIAERKDIATSTAISMEVCRCATSA
ncbi:hypothetical protein DM01DRAFT_1369349 [Hesseltinella vesiculosa]|uniref:Ndc10 domain-containing protein n=1 Tax=Hesseltinella vesiculosa TaxID=101127 RepID=A0A1X2GXF5_9FUNG|nr:hypothetical protein DM01DRAFT_1369349 [Hesseltinella vesiculosa]